MSERSLEDGREFRQKHKEQESYEEDIGNLWIEEKVGKRELRLKETSCN